MGGRVYVCFGGFFGAALVCLLSVSVSGVEVGMLASDSFAECARFGRRLKCVNGSRIHFKGGRLAVMYEATLFLTRGRTCCAV